MLSLAKKECEVNELAARLDQQQEDPSKLRSIGQGHSQTEGQQSNESLPQEVSGTAIDSLTMECERALQKAEQQITARQDENRRCQEAKEGCRDEAGGRQGC